MNVYPHRDLRSTARHPANAQISQSATPSISYYPSRVSRAPKRKKHTFVSPFPATLTHSLSRKSFPCHSYANTRDRGVTAAPNFQSEAAVSARSWRQISRFHTLADSLSLPKKLSPVESSKSRLFSQNTRGGVSRINLRNTRVGVVLPIAYPAIAFYRCRLARVRSTGPGGRVRKMSSQ